MLICFEEEPKMGYLQKFILFLSIFKQSEVANTTNVCLFKFTGFASFFYFIIFKYFKKIL
jgi:hypothetical protein